MMVLWPDGTTIMGRDATEALQRLGEEQWTPCDVAEMKQQLSDRAWVWNRSAVDPELPDDQFFEPLHETGMCEILVWPGDND